MTTQEGGSQVDKEEADVEEDADDKPMTFWEHLDELRKRVVWSVVSFFVACFAAWEIREWMLGLLVKPFAESWKAQNLAGNPSLHFGAPSAAFMAYLKLTMIGGAAIAAPMVFYQLWSFIAPGLYAREKRFVIPFVLCSTLLFVGGGYFGWRLAFPITFDYFLSMSGTVGAEAVVITPTVMMGEYLDFCAQMLLAFGIIFEIPLFILFLSVAGIVNYLQLIRFGRWFILVAFVLAAILTPPEATSQVMMAVPMCLLYGISIGVAWLFGKPPTEAQREAYRRRKEKKAA
ncbi:MAG: twin-arginine translocase subunit TatC [Polyangiaceae bacterium]|nr:twin-arginine translocase subunit TatC [Polyangiaceae bacterium]NUQ78918.1 twin-arginine translocase subunit TatC [Polyangiaceae bacterium]